MPLSDAQMSVIVATERTCSAVSVMGSFIIISTFLLSPLFRKPINRLVFYACWGNLMSNVATFISHSGNLHGIESPLCQLQGFLIQWFIPADALWTFAMACNVYLTFFHKYSATQLRQIEWKYILLCYGLPFVPAFTYFFIRTDAKGPIYGPADLWCWVSLPWDFLRIAVFYGPVWFVILLTFGIYIRAGKEIYQNRNQLQNLSSVDNHGNFVERVFDVPLSKVTEVQITSEAAGLRAENSRQMDVTRKSQPALYSSYSVTVESGDMPQGYAIPRRILTEPMDTNGRRRSPKSEAAASAWAYFKYAILYFIALLVTWVPSTINRVYTLFRPSEINFGLELTSSLVLPLQGFWNSIIYAAISWSSMKALFHHFRRSPRRDKNSLQLPRLGRPQET